MNGVSLLKCICDETRFEILELLQKNKELCVNDFVERLKKDSDSFKAAPVFTPIRRLDETQAARKPVLRWKEEPLIAV